MKFTTSAAALLMLASGIQAHPEKMTPEKAKREALMVGRSTGKCAAAIEARKAEVMAKRSARLLQRRLDDGKITHEEMMAKRNELQYTTIQNDTCVLAPDTIWGPYGIDGEIVRHDLRELSTGQCVPVFESTPVNLTNNNRIGRVSTSTSTLVSLTLRLANLCQMQLCPSGIAMLLAHTRDLLALTLIRLHSTMACQPVMMVPRMTIRSCAEFRSRTLRE